MGTRTAHIRLSGILRTLPYRNLIQAENHTVVMGWGAMLSSVARPTNSLSTYATVNYGRGYSGLGTDLMMGNYDLVGRHIKTGRTIWPDTRTGLPGTAGIKRDRRFPEGSACQKRWRLPTLPLSQYHRRDKV